MELTATVLFDRFNGSNIESWYIRLTTSGRPNLAKLNSCRARIGNSMTDILSNSVDPMKTIRSVLFKVLWLRSCKLIFSKFLKYILVQNIINLLVPVFQKQFLTFKSHFETLFNKNKKQTRELSHATIHKLSYARIQVIRLDKYHLI